MCLVLVLLMAYFRRHPSTKKIPEPPQVESAQAPVMSAEEIKRIHAGFKTQTEILSRQPLETSQASLEIPAPVLEAVSPPSLEVTATSAVQPALDTASPQVQQSKDELKRQQEMLRREQETLKQQLKAP